MSYQTMQKLNKVEQLMPLSKYYGSMQNRGG